MLDRFLSSLMAVCLAFLVWLYARNREQESLDNVPIPVQLVLAPSQAEQYELEVTGPCQVPVSFMGPPSRIRELRGLLHRGEMAVTLTVTVPAGRLQDSRYLDTVRVAASDVHPPPGVTPLVDEGHNRIAVTLHHLVERRLPVRLEHTGEDRVTQVSVEPATVLVRGPQEVLDRVRAIPTQLYTVPTSTDPPTGGDVVVAAGVPLVQELEGRRIRPVPGAVKVRLTVQPPQRVYELNEVPVQFLCPANFPLRPLFGDERAGKITLWLQGPAVDEPPAVLAFIDLSGRRWEAGFYEEPLRVQLPKDFQLAQPPPRSVAFRLVRTEPRAGEGEVRPEP